MGGWVAYGRHTILNTNCSGLTQFIKIPLGNTEHIKEGTSESLHGFIETLIRLYCSVQGCIQAVYFFSFILTIFILFIYLFIYFIFIFIIYLFI